MYICMHNIECKISNDFSYTEAHICIRTHKKKKKKLPCTNRMKLLMRNNYSGGITKEYFLCVGAYQGHAVVEHSSGLLQTGKHTTHQHTRQRPFVWHPTHRHRMCTRRFNTETKVTYDYTLRG